MISDGSNHSPIKENLVINLFSGFNTIQADSVITRGLPPKPKVTGSKSKQRETENEVSETSPKPSSKAKGLFTKARKLI